MVLDPSTHVDNLLRLGEVDAAERELRALLRAEPDDAPSRSLHALCLAELGRLEEAEGEAERAVRTEPFLAYCQWALGMVLADRGLWGRAAAAARQALDLAPESGDAHALLGRAEAGAGQWEHALRAAEDGLDHEPEHVGCANLRAVALQALKRDEEADQALVDAAAADPENAFARAARGWSALRRGAAGGEALPYFQHALAIDPRSDWARDGLLAALKARNPLYRAMLRFFVWMDDLGPRARWAVILGGLLGYNLLRRTVQAAPETAPLVYPLMGAYLLFVLLSWVTEPVFDFLLRCDPVGRASVPPARARAGSAVAAALGLAIVAAVAGIATGSGTLLLLALLAGVLAIPLSSALALAPGWRRTVMGGYTAAVAAVGALGLAAAAAGRGDSLVFLALVGAAVGSWIGTALREAKPAA